MRAGFRKICDAIIAASDPAVLEAANLIADEIEHQAPRITGSLAHSITVAQKHDLPRGVAWATVKVTGGHEPQDMVAAVEFGRVGQEPDPFIRRSFASKKREALRRMIQAATTALKTH